MEVLSDHKKFEQIINAQGGKIRLLAPGPFKKDMLAKKSGKISEIKNREINLLGRITGCPVDKSAGLYLYFHVKDKVKKGDKILTIYSESKSRLNDSIQFYNEKDPIKIKSYFAW